VICRPGLLHFGEIRGSLARGHPLAIDVGKEPAIVRHVTSLCFPRVALSRA
jgi:hypothetical protein